jgi:DNA-binding MarR family transcriptional regulator
VAEGQVERLEVEGDRRAYRVRLTPRGRKTFDDMARQHEHWIVQAFGGLGPREIETLHKLLGKVKQHQIDLGELNQETENT